MLKIKRYSAWTDKLGKYKIILDGSEITIEVFQNKHS